MSDQTDGQPEIAAPQNQAAKVGKKMPSSIVVWPVGWLIVLGVIWLKYRSNTTVDVFGVGGGIPTAAIWFGALGGVAGSLHGMFMFNDNWDDSYDLWHRCAPLMGAIYGAFSFLFITVVAKTAAAGTVDSKAAVFAIGAFALGYSQKQFSTLLTKVFNTIFLPAKGTES